MLQCAAATCYRCTQPYLRAVCFSFCRQQLLQNLTLGLAPQDLPSIGGSSGSSNPSELGPEAFLIRGMAFDKSGAMVVGDAVRVGQQLRFMVRAALPIIASQLRARTRHALYCECTNVEKQELCC